jgi:nitric oxide reductase NorD protein
MLDWEEGLFKGGRALVDALWIQRRRKPFQVAEVTLASVRMESFYLAHLLAGEKMALFETDEPLLRIGHRICLPRAFSGHADSGLNREFFRLKTALAALSWRERKAFGSLPGSVGGSSHDSNGSEAFREWLGIHYPVLLELWQKQSAGLPPDFPLVAHLETLREEDAGEGNPGDTHKDADEDLALGEKTLSKDATEIDGKGRTQVDVLQGEDLQAPDVPQHTFEKVETLDEFDGIDRQLDGADDIRDHEQALDEVEMRHVLRSKDRAASLYKADILLNPFELESRGKTDPLGIPYSEWDFRKKAYKENWCHVQVCDLVDKDEVWLAAAKVKYGPQIHQLKRRLSQFSTDYLRSHAQPFGNELDVEAAVDARIRMATGGMPSENLYLDRRRDWADVATLLLVDLSDSTDAWVKGEHVLETLRSALYCVGETLEAFTHSFGIAGFASDTRHACKYFPIKDIDSPWREAIPKLGALRAQGYTRMGPILRHATKLLDKQAARKKAILLITDGRPCDYDTYEGHYGIQDIKKAFGEARDQGILSHAFAIDHKAREYFPAMFAPRQFSVIGNPKDLADAIFRFFMALKLES